MNTEEVIARNVPVKPWWESKLIMLGLIEIAISILQFAQTTDWTDRNAWMVFAMGVLTILGRWVTDEPITSVVPELDRFRQGVVPNPKAKSGRSPKKSNHRLKN